MRQILHIVRKDIRHLWLRTLILLLLVAAHAGFEVHSLPVSVPETMRSSTILSLLNLLLPLGIWFLIAWLIFEEPLAGDRQFWLTRPYSWPKLLASKVLFVVVFLNVPLFLSDCYILAAQEFAVSAVLPALLLRQLMISVLFLLPPFVVATLTRGVSQFLLGWFILLLAFVAESMLASFWAPPNTGIVVGGASFYLVVLLAVSCGIVFWQYARRGTIAARVALIAVTFGYLPSVAASFMFPRSRAVAPKRPEFGDFSHVAISYDRDRSVPPATNQPTPAAAFVVARIPLVVSGLPFGSLLRGQTGLDIVIGGANRPAPDTFPAGNVERRDGLYWLTVNLSTASLDVLKRQRAELHGNFDLEIVRDEVETTIPVAARSFRLANVGLCHIILSSPQTFLTCRAGLQPSLETAVRFESSGAATEIIATLSEHSTPGGLSPASEVGMYAFPRQQAGRTFEFLPRWKVAQFQRTLELHDVDLSKYLVPR